jgi:hypothetical protein
LSAAASGERLSAAMPARLKSAARDAREDQHKRGGDRRHDRGGDQIEMMDIGRLDAQEERAGDACAAEGQS